MTGQAPTPHGQPTQANTPLPLRAITINDTFWAARQQINHERTIPHIYDQLIQTERIAAFRPDWRPSAQTATRHPWGGTPVMFWDSDVAKWIEAASYCLALRNDPGLDQLLDQVIALIAGAQHADGYLNTWFTAIDPGARWTNLRDWHELYCAGHMIEAAVAHYQATGKRTLLDVLCRYADYIASVFGSEPEKRHGYCGHPEIELALVRLAAATGEQRYLDLSRYFVNERGRQPHYFEQESLARGEEPAKFWARSYEYNQSHLPVREQQQVVGHAVRAVYLYSAMADLAMADHDASLAAAGERLWQHLTTTRTYVMGGIGTSRHNEGFTSDYDLPNASAYAETCAAIGLVFWAQRMLQINPDRRYSDTLELALYNAVLSGVSLAGDSFFYDNPLESNGSHHRQGWFECPCCPPNLARIIASLGQYIYAQSEREAVIHLFVQSSADMQFAGQRVVLHQQTNYPWDGAVTIRVESEQPTAFAMRIRIPGWCHNPQASLNGTPLDLTTLEAGYLRIERVWQPGDCIQLDLVMTIDRLYAHPAVRPDIGRVALRRGPLIFCLEQADQQADVTQIVLPNEAQLTARFDPDLLGGVVVLEGIAATLDQSDWQGQLYRETPVQQRPCSIRAIPYFSWDNRQPGAMAIWLPVGH